MLSAPGGSLLHEDSSSASTPAGSWLRTAARGPAKAPAALAALPVIAGIVAIAVSWQSWIDPLVDSGREMDVPWRLLQGERLYRDITYYYGPIGPWVNALELRLFGNVWLSLELVCTAVSAVIFLLLFRLTRRAGGLLSAATATTLAAAVCMAAPRGGAFVFPYSSSGLFALAGGLLALDAAAAPAVTSATSAIGALRRGLKSEPPRPWPWYWPGYGPVTARRHARTCRPWHSVRCSPAASMAPPSPASPRAACSPSARSGPFSACPRSGASSTG